APANARIKTYLWPDEAGKLDFKTTEAAFGSDSVARGSAFGVAKTHELIFDFHTGNFGESAAKNAIDAFNSDILITASPEWVSDTAVLGRVAAYDKRFNAAEDFLSRLFDWSARQIVNFRWYGMVDFGDTLSWYRQKDPDVTYDDFGWHPVGRWGWFNCEAVGTHSGALIQFLRTGDYKYYYFGANQARHIMDIDTCHYNTVANDKRLKGVIFDDYSRVGSMHRHNGNHWGDRSEEASHTNVFGILLYYHMTGDPRALDVIGEIGQFFLSERITYFRHPDIAPQRTLANILWGDVQLYEFTGDEKYKKAADKWAQVFFEGQKSDGAWAENYNPVKKRWEGGPHMMYIQQYTVPAMIAYHQLTGNKAIAKCIANVTDFIIDNATYNSYCDALAYSYWLTGDGMYSSKIAERMGFIAKHQNRSADPIWDGMIYQKAYYARPDEFLYNVCYGFEVLQEAPDGRK
ncbi:MAG: glycoside hydrolase family 127 protein, partial [Candidatus Omnitrophota bacterium]|nr:glycoside hydrolase family 127 protein [Candidatus Omnitrophota bacterium]